MVKVPRAQTHREAQCVPGWRIGEELSILGFQVIIRKTGPWTIVGNVFGDCHVACTLNTSVVDWGCVFP
jgi:hypothetical protein